MALVHVYAAILAGKSGTALAAIIVVQVRTGSSVGAGFREAQIDSVLAQRSNETGNALAPELVNHIHARAAVIARISLAVVNVYFASRSTVPIGTLAAEGVSLVRANATVLARAWIALVDLDLASRSAVSGRTIALEPLKSVFARPMQAGLLRTRYRFLLTVSSDPTVGTIAPVTSLLLVVTHSVVEAWRGRAIADDRFALGAGKARRTLARVRALARVEAGSTVLARFVVGAKVQVLVAEQTAPAFVAQALPRLLAGSVHAARVRFALVAQLSLPSGLADAFVGLIAMAVLLITSGGATGGRTVVTLPAGEAHPLAVRGASVVAELVVTLPTQVGTSRPVVR